MIPWIQVYSNVVAHPKTTRLAEELDIKSGCVHPRIVAVGMLVAIWTWAVQNAYDGDLSRVSPSVIAEACRWKKTPQRLWDALVASGYLDFDGHLHDWDEYAVLFMDAEERRREKTRERVRRYRRRTAAGDGNAAVTVTGVTGNAATIQDQDHTGNGDDNDDTSSLSERVREETESGRQVAAPTGAEENGGRLIIAPTERTTECGVGANTIRPSDTVQGRTGGRLIIAPTGAEENGGRQVAAPTGAEVDESVRSAIRRRWGRDADERDLARGRREMVYFGDDGALHAYDAALVDYVFAVSERAGVQAQNWRFVEGVMRRLRQRGIVTVEDALVYDEERI